MANEVRIDLVVGEDGTQKLVAFNDALKETKPSADAAGEGTKHLEDETKSFKEVVKGARSEHRMYTFAIREGTMAIGDLSESLLGEGGVGKALRGGANEAFGFKFALDAASNSMKSAGGSVGMMGAALEGIAMPIAIGVAGLVMLKSQLGSLIDERSKKMVDDFKRSIGMVDPEDKMTQALQKLSEAAQDVNGRLSFWETMKLTMMNMIGLGTQYADSLVKQRQATLEAREEEVKRLKTLQDMAKAVEDEYQLNGAIIEQMNLMNQTGPLQTLSLQIANQEIYIGKLKEEHADKLEIVKAENELLKLQDERRLMVMDQTEAKIAGQITQLKAKDDNWLTGIKEYNLDHLTAFEKAQIGIIKTTKIISAEQALRQIERDDAEYIKAWKQQNIIAWGAIDAVINQSASQMGSMFNDVWSGIFDNAHSDLDKFLLGVLDAIDQIVAKMLSEAAVFALLNFITGGTSSWLPKLKLFHFHEGGVIPVAHSGMVLGGDERLVVAQTGERILSRQQNQQYERNGGGGGGLNLTMNVSAIDAQSFTSHFNKKENMQALVSVIQRAQQYGKV